MAARPTTEPVAQRSASEAGPVARPAARAVPQTRPHRIGPGRRRQRRLKTALRLAVLQATVLAAVLGVVVVALARAVSTNDASIVASTLAGQLDSYRAAASRTHIASAADLFAFSHRYLQTHSLFTGEQLVVAVPGQGVVGTNGTRSVLAARALGKWVAAPPPASRLVATRIDGRDTELLVAPIEGHGRTLGTFVVSTPLGRLDRQRANVIDLSLAEAAVALIAGALSAYLLLRRLLRTVGRITSAAEEIHEGDLDTRLGDQGTDDEVSQLAATFDAMLDRLSAVMGNQRRLLSDVSHQLRTPLTVARGHLEVLTRAGCDDPVATADTVGLVLDELGHMSSLVDSLLLLGRAIEPDFLQLEPLDLRAFLADLYEAARILAERQWTITAVPDVVLWADSAKLRGAVLNVVDNAIKVTRPHDAVALSADLAPDGRSVLVAVDDSGPGIPPDQRQAVLERFTRLHTPGVPGSGLGLAIADAVATAHGGRVEISTSVLGGARVAIRLPSDVAWHPDERLA